MGSGFLRMRSLGMDFEPGLRSHAGSAKPQNICASSTLTTLFGAPVGPSGSWWYFGLSNRSRPKPRTHPSPAALWLYTPQTTGRTPGPSQTTPRLLIRQKAVVLRSPPAASQLVASRSMPSRKAVRLQHCLDFPGQRVLRPL